MREEGGSCGISANEYSCTQEPNKSYLTYWSGGWLRAAVFNLKYYQKRVRRPQNLRKERTERVLHRYLLAHQRGATTDLPSGSLTLQEPVLRLSKTKMAGTGTYTIFICTLIKNKIKL